MTLIRNEDPEKGEEIELDDSTREAFIYSKHITDDGVHKEWGNQYLIITPRGSITFRESATDINRGIIGLHDIVEVELYTDSPPPPGPDTPENLPTDQMVRIETRSKSVWIFCFADKAMFKDWFALLQRDKGVRRKEDNDPPPPPPVYHKPKYTLKTFFENRKLFGEMWMVYAFIAYTVVLVVLFAVWYTQWITPFKNMTKVEASCHILSSEAEYTYRHNYILHFDVTYYVDGVFTESEMKQNCGGSDCPEHMDDAYPVGSYRTCYYNEDEPSFVFFEFAPLINRRYGIIFGVCGGLFAPWVIFVITMISVRYKWLVKVIKNGCW